VRGDLSSWPEVRDEITAIAEGAGQNPSELFAVNARTEILAGLTAAECSVLGVLPSASASGHVLLAQNWDWHPDFAGSLVWWQVSEPSGHWFATLTEAGLLAKIGINSHRLGCCLNLLASTADGRDDGLPIHVALRLVLQTCATVESAVALLHGQSFAASSAITVASPYGGGAVATVEVSPGGARTVSPDGAGRLVHTNHFLQPPPRGADQGRTEWPHSLDRWDDVASQLAVPGGVTVARVRQALRSHRNPPLSTCRHDADNPVYLDRTNTLASIVMDLTAPTVHLAPGAPCAHGFAGMGLPEAQIDSDPAAVPSGDVLADDGPGPLPI
jgi:isopenicillin-N N-acyltransferase-like protein